MKFAVYGTGGVGGYFGGRLAQAGEDVTFIARGAHLAAMRQNGLKVESLLGHFSIDPVQATDNPAEVGPVDVVLLGVKTWQVTDAAQAMRPMIGPETLVIPLQNGVTAADEVAAVLGAEHVIGGLCRISALVPAPGLVRHVGVPPYVAFGPLNGETRPRVAEIHAAFARCQGLTVEIPVDIKVALWNKFLFIAAASGVGAVTRQPMGVYRAVPESRALLQAALEETSAVARARGVNLPAEAVQKTLAFIDSSAPEIMASMQRDIMEGRPSELDAQNGAVVRLGREMGVPTPTHAFIYAALLPGELKARGA